jgi:hypothetical protein
VLRNVIRIDFANRQTETSVIEQMHDERQALLNELRDTKLVLALILEVHGSTLVPQRLMVHFDEKHTDIIEQRESEGFRYSLEKWEPK